MKLSDLKPAPFNPRTISDKAFSGLGYSIEEFGDLSGLVFNNKTGNLVCGHQRLKAIQDKYGDLEVEDSKITLPTGEIFPVHYVDWSLKKEKAANVAANSKYISGSWDASLGDLLGEIQADLPDLFTDLNFEDLLADVPEIEIEPSGSSEDSQESPPRDKEVECPDCGCKFTPEKEDDK